MGGKTLCAYYISGLAYTILIGRDYSFSSIAKVIFFQRIPGYSEFLLSFALIYPLVYLWLKCTKRIKNFYYLILVSLSLIFTLIDYGKIQVRLVGAIIGSDTFSCFPIIQYMSYFIAGYYLASENKIFDKLVLLFSILGSGNFIIYLIIFKRLPGRFPPTALWIMGGYLFVYLYFVFCKCFSEKFKKIRIMPKIGANSLAFLVISNLVIFLMKRCLGEWFFTLSSKRKLFIYFCLFILCMCFSFLWIETNKKMRQKVKNLKSKE